jgi:hypothetical protein
MRQQPFDHAGLRGESQVRMRFLLIGSILVAGLTAPVVMADPGGHGYNSIPHKLPGNLPSVGFEANQTSEFGNQITFGDPKKKNKFGTVVVTMSSWGCQSGHWYDDTCSTPKGKQGFSEPITLNIYNPPTTGMYVPGSPIVSVTQTFFIPYRPSADNVNCTGADLGEWYDKPSKTCFNGLANNISFDIDPHVTLPDSVVFGIAYNTSTAGYTPYGVATACYVSSGGCGYDSLNVGLSQDPTDVSEGSDPNTGTVWWNTSTPANYCDAGAHGSDFFRLDSPSTPPCWGVNPPYNAAPFYIPAVQFKD